MLDHNGINFANILRAPFLPIYLNQKITSTNCEYRKASQVSKSCSLSVGRIDATSLTILLIFSGSGHPPSLPCHVHYTLKLKSSQIHLPPPH